MTMRPKIPSFSERLRQVSALIRLPSQYGTLLVLAPALWSLFIVSGGRPRAHHLFVFIVGAFLMRSAGCAINDIADRGFDRFVERTKGRPLACGGLGLAEAVAVFVALALLSFALVLTLNRLTIALSFVAIVLAAGYPFVKRVSHFPQTVLGMAFGWGAVMAWAAVSGRVG
ncbi:MAG: UbiA family prenyltransferase, partial [Proteobacteria bacterium]|nr:UbiA family prenyltransferase [Pseudomonadota bacterium]